jgi:hypothetical protein
MRIIRLETVLKAPETIFRCRNVHGAGAGLDEWVPGFVQGVAGKNLEEYGSDVEEGYEHHEGMAAIAEGRSLGRRRCKNTRVLREDGVVDEEHADVVKNGFNAEVLVKYVSIRRCYCGE